MRVILRPHARLNRNNSTKVKHRNTHVLAVRPGPTRPSHTFNQNKRTPKIAIVEYFDKESQWDYEPILDWTPITASKYNTGIQPYRLFAQTRWDRPIDSADHRRCSMCCQGTVVRIWCHTESNPIYAKILTGIQTYKLLVQSQRDCHIDLNKIKARKPLSL